MSDDLIKRYFSYDTNSVITATATISSLNDHIFTSFSLLYIMLCYIASNMSTYTVD